MFSSAGWIVFIRSQKGVVKFRILDYFFHKTDFPKLLFYAVLQTALKEGD